MPPSEKQISPEEKLLKVIQGGDQGKSALPSGEEKLLKAVQGGKTEAASKAPAVEPKPKEPSPVGKPEAATKTKPATKTESAATKSGVEQVVEETAKSGAKPKLKVAKAEEPARGAVAAAEPPEPAAEKPKTPAAGPVKKSAGRKFHVRTINSWLAATVLVSVCLSAYQIWAGTQSVREGAAPPPPPHVVPASVHIGEQANGIDFVTKFLDSLTNRDMFNWNAGVAVAATNQMAPLADWIIYARDNIKLKAFMGSPEKGNMEAIVTDKGNHGKMSFLKVGQRVTVGSQDVSVKEFQSDQIIFSDGVREQAIK